MTSGDEPERYRRLRELFDRAVELESDVQRAFLERECPDPDLRREVERLLAADRDEHAAFGTESPWRGASGERVFPERIGGYRIVGRLGEGGMGSVFAAEQDHPRRRVALKLMHVGLLTPAMQRRFEYEGEVLARLAHPGIAHVYEAGTAAIGGVTLPFFAMELVNGVPITRFARERGLGLRERLDLVARVADAVEHAHHMGVIHRDLKPQNILVDESSQPRILDFGIARATQDDERSDSLRTKSGMLVGTLAYMSPEQAGGDPRALDTRSDVYSLGVLAYELVTGRLPLDLSKASIAHAAKIITEEEPTRPGVIDHRLRGDVETIVLKALEKDKQRRYASAAALAADLRAFLDHQPIAARRATTIYQLRKFTRRHPGLVLGLAATFLALIVGLVVSLSYYAKSETARVAAEKSGAAEVRARQRADSINDFVLKEIFAAPDPWAPAGKDVTVASTLDRIAGKVSESFAGDPELAADAHATLAGSYLARGMAERGSEHARLALELRRGLHTGDHRDVAESLLTSARAHADRGDLVAAGTDARAALLMYQRLPDVSRETMADATRQVARVQLSKGEHAEALKGFESVLATQQVLHGAEHPAIAQALSDVLAAQIAAGDVDGAERTARETLALRRRLHSNESPFVATSLNDLASVLFEKRDPVIDAEIEKLETESVAIFTRTLGPEHRLTLLARRGQANALVRLERFIDAERILREVTEALPRAIGEEHEDNVQTLNSYGYLLFSIERMDEAEVQYQKAIAISERVFGPDNANTIRPLSNLAFLEKDRGLEQGLDLDKDGKLDVEADSDLAHAIDHFRSALAGSRKLYGELHENTMTVAFGLGDLLDRLGRYPEAAELLGQYAQSLLLNKPAEYEQTVTRVLMRQGLALMRSGAPAEGEPVLRRSVERCRAVFPAGDWRTAICASTLGECLTRVGKLDEAETVLVEALAVLEPQRAQRKRNYDDAVRRLAELYDAQGKPERARELREKQ